MNDRDESRQVDASDEPSKHQRQQPRVDIVVAMQQHHGRDNEEWQGIQRQHVEREELCERQLETLDCRRKREPIQLDRDLARAGVRVPLHRQANESTWTAAIDGVAERIDCGEGSTVNRGNAVSRAKTRACAGTIWFDAVDTHRALSLVERETDAR